MSWSQSKNSRDYVPLSAGDTLDPEDVIRSDRRRSRKILSLTQPLLTFGAGVLVTSLFFFLFGGRINQTPKGRATQSKTSSFRSPVPELPLAIVTFEENETFSSRPTFENDVAWNHLLPPGRGFVYVANGSSYGLEHGESTDWGEIYSVAVFHQLHCLGQLRKAYWTMIDGVESGDLSKSQMLLGHGGEHVAHCFDYLRQSVMCAGDMAMEWPRTEENGVRVAVDGWEIPHQCKSWDAIMEYMDEAHFNHSMNSNIAPD